MTDHEAIARVEELAGWLGENNEAALTLAASVTAEHAADLRLLLDLAKQVGGLREALGTARTTIEALHGPTAWDIYDRCSPEMKAINAALRQSKETGE